MILIDSRHGGKAVIFDFDGVIIDSTEVQRRALFESYELIVGGKDHPSFDEFLSHSGDSLVNILRKMKLPVEMVGHYKVVSRRNLGDIKVYEGIEELLIKLRNRKVKCGIFTGKDRARTLEILTYHCLMEYFDVVVCSDDIERPKPDPEGLLLAMKALDVDVRDAIMVGDAPNDIASACNAMVKSIRVSWGEASKCTFGQYVPDFTADTVEKLFECIVKLSSAN
jgi:pyrophosphatase PpaX